MPRKSLTDIRNRMERSLRRRPMNLWELSNDSGVTYRTVKREIERLVRLGVVLPMKFLNRNGKIETVYQLKVRKFFDVELSRVKKIEEFTKR